MDPYFVCAFDSIYADSFKLFYYAGPLPGLHVHRRYYVLLFFLLLPVFFVKFGRFEPFLFSFAPRLVKAPAEGAFLGPPGGSVGDFPFI